MVPRFRPVLGPREWLSAAVPNKGSVERFEREFAAAFSCHQAVAFGYGRTALLALFEAMGLMDCEIIMPAYTCSVVAHAVTLSGNVPHFVDIDPLTFNMRLDQVAEAVNERTGAIVATHLFGRALDLDELDRVVQESERRLGRQLLVIQDCAHSFGATWRGRLVASARNASIFGLNISKLMTSIFGGMVATLDSDLSDRLRTFRKSRLKSAGPRKSSRRLVYLAAASLAFTKPGYAAAHWLSTKTPLLKGLTDAYHLDDRVEFPPDAFEVMCGVEARVGVAQLRRYSQMIARRRAAAEFYFKKLPTIEPEWQLPPPDDGATWSHFVARVPDRTEARRRWLTRGIELGELIQYSVAHLSPYRDCPGAARCVESLRASRDTVNLPMPDGIIS